MKKILFCYIVAALAISTTNAQSLNKNTIDTPEFIDNPPLYDVKPMFPGGSNAFERFLSKNLRYPKNGADISGRVILSFMILPSGHLTDFTVEKKLFPEYDKEALRVMRKSPKWQPGRKNGKAIAVKYYIPIHFK